MNINNLITIYDINRSCPPNKIVVSHDSDVNTRMVEVIFRQGLIPLVISTECTAKAAFVERQSNILINDNVPCTVTDSGHVLIPVDNLHRQGRFDMNIELTVTNQDGEKVLVTPFPMWITVNGSILNKAEVTEESKGTVPELLEAAEEALADAKDYEKLDNLPAINGHVLTGNQTAENLGMQDKLTAGDNITIENGVISAKDSGVTDYADLTGKPVISAGNPLEAAVPKWTFTNELDFEPQEFNGMRVDDGRIIITIDKEFPRFSPALHSYDFNDIGASPFSSYNGYLNFEYGITDVSNFPAALSDLDTSKTFFIYQSFKTSYSGDSFRYMLRKVIGQSLTGEYLEYAQFCGINYRESSGKVVSQTEWVKLSNAGGSEIASGTINSDGTITFYDKDGNPLFTTTGASVIGPQGNSVTSAEILNNHLIIHIGVLQPDGTILNTPIDVGRVVGQGGARGQHGDGYTAAQIDENGDLIMTEVVYTSQGSTPMARQVNLGRVVGADGISVTGAEINNQGHLILTLSDGATIDAGYIGTPKTDIAGAVITLSTSEFIYDGNQKIPTIRSVMLHGTTLVKNQDYVVISSPETAIGDYLLVIQGIGNYSGTSSTSWSIEAHGRRVFGVMWDYSLSSPQLTRLTPQNDPLAIVTNAPSQEPTACIGNDGNGQSDFDNYMPWKGMRRYNYIDGQIIDFVDYQNGETFVYIPKFWSKIVNDTTNSKMYFYISSAELEGFTKHHGSGRYMSRYECNENFLSAPSTMPKVNTNLTNFRSSITAIDNKHYQYDIHTYNALQLLYIVEFANLNSQAKIGAGITSGGKAFNVGETDILAYHTGRIVGTINNVSAVQYRWIENLWGNVLNWVDGVLIQDGLVYFCNDATKYSSTITDDYISTELTISTSEGWHKTDNNYNNCYLIPATLGGSNSTYMCDYYYCNAGLRGLMTGGDSGSSSYAGLFFWYCGFSPDIAAAVGGRSILILGGES